MPTAKDIATLYLLKSGDLLIVRVGSWRQASSSSMDQGALAQLAAHGFWRELCHENDGQGDQYARGNEQRRQTEHWPERGENQRPKSGSKARHG